jgi:nicotinate phosphoribosyltransferase
MSKIVWPYYDEKLAQHSAIWGDLYALTMAQAFYTNSKHNLNTTFHAYIRKNPFEGSYLLTGGQNIIFDWLEKHWQFDEIDLQIMADATVPDPVTGKPQKLFSPDFIDMLQTAKLELTIDAMPEGEIAFPDEPIYRVHGPLWQCLMVEAAILNTLNSQALFATLASRLSEVAEGAPILAFGLRRAQCIGGLESARGSFIGGASATSNTLAHKYYGMPWAGTFAHALVMTYEDELQAFSEYAQAMPYNGIFLVDTYDTLEGVKKAIKACKDHNIKLKGIRLDSGDLAYLSIEARKILNEAGFTEAKISASNDLDEDTIQSLKIQGAEIDVWGVGTNLETSKAQPALGAVYKLASVFDGELSQEEIASARLLIQQGQSPASEDFVRNVIKLSEDVVKVTIPGELDVLRYMKMNNGKAERFDGDTIISNLMRDPVARNTNEGWAYPDTLAFDVESVPKNDETLAKTFAANASVYRPLQSAFVQGQRTAPHETIHDARERAQRQLALLDKSHRRTKNPHIYRVGIERDLFERRKAMIKALRQSIAK